MPRYYEANAIAEMIKAGTRNDEAKRMCLLEGLSEMPTADVAEVKHGNWVGIDDDPCETFECDRCGFVLDDWIQGALYNYCPNCGADMREETEDEL